MAEARARASFANSRLLRNRHEHPASPRPAPTIGPRLWAKPQSQRQRRQKRVGLLQRLLTFGRAAAGPSDTAALRPSPPPSEEREKKAVDSPVSMPVLT